MFYVRYVLAEVCRRPGRTVLTGLGLAVGVGLVVIVSALCKGLDDAQGEVLEPLTGVGTDLSVSRPLAVPDEEAAGGARLVIPSAGSPRRSKRQLERENREHTAAFDYSDLGKPGGRFSEVSLLSSGLSFPASAAAAMMGLRNPSAATGTAAIFCRTLRTGCGGSCAWSPVTTGSTRRCRAGHRG